MDKNSAINAEWFSGKTTVQNALDHILPGKFDTRNFASIKQEVEFFEEPLNPHSVQNIIDSQVTTNKKKDLENNEQASSSTLTRAHNSWSTHQVLNGVQVTKSENSRYNAQSVERSWRLEPRGQIDILEMPIDQISQYKYFSVYEDQQTKFVVLEALRDNTAKTVARKLLNAIAIIGAPKVLQSKNGRNFAREVVYELHLLWKGVDILHGDISKCEQGSRDFRSLLISWANNNPTKTWYEGLKYIQVFQNSICHCKTGKIPCDVLFGRNIHEEFQKLTSVKETINNISKEEEWVNLQLKENEIDHNNIDAITECDEKLIPESILKNTRTGQSEDQSTSSHNDEDLHFNFVNVKNETPSNSSQSEDALHQEEDVVHQEGVHKINEGAVSLKNCYLRCTICQKQYIKQGHLKNHMKTHMRGQKFECTVCDKTFRVLSLYEKHMRQFHGYEKLFSLTDYNRVNQIKTKKNEDSNNIIIQVLSEENPLSTSNINVSLSKENNGLVNIVSKCTRSKKSSSLTHGKKLRKNRILKINLDPTLECTYCKQKFNFPSVLKRHMRSHTNERPYICEVCNKSFKQLGHLSQHSLTHKNYRSFQCSVCGIKFPSFESLKVHSLSSHKGETSIKSKGICRLFECDNCKKVFTTKSVLERHIFTHTHERQYGCKICGKRFKQAGHVKSHMLVHTGERKFQCTVCSKRFSLSNSLKKHMYVHNGEKPYQCDVCGSRFLEKRNLNGHIMTHTNERPFVCKLCGKRYTLADTLRRHISAAHEDGRTYQCEICAKMFKQLAHLSVHKKVHNDERPFQCHLCEKNFKHKNVLKSHLAIHANVRPFECDICKATFVRKTNLQTHIASAHMNERPYTCTICGKRFKQISHLNGHVVVHSNSMPYQCDYCDRRCNRLDNLKKHMRLHTKNKE